MSEQSKLDTGAPAEAVAGVPAVRQTAAAVHLRQRHADREPDFAADPAASAGAGQGARHRAADRAAFQECGGQDRPVLAEPVQGAGAAGRTIPRAGRCFISARRRSPISIPTARSSRSTARARSSRTSARILGDIEGIVLLDGTWSQAKALWWRNAWMLKCQRVILGPKRPSRYGQAPPRAAPRRPFHHRGGRDAAGWP